MWGEMDVASQKITYISEKGYKQQQRCYYSSVYGWNARISWLASKSHVRTNIAVGCRCHDNGRGALPCQPASKQRRDSSNNPAKAASFSRREKLVDDSSTGERKEPTCKWVADSLPPLLACLLACSLAYFLTKDIYTRCGINKQITFGVIPTWFTVVHVEKFD